MSNLTKRRTFTQWQRELDDLIQSKVALDSSCLPQLDLAKAYRVGEAPTRYFEQSVKPQLATLGFNVDLLEGLEEAAAEMRSLRAAYGQVPAVGI